MTVGSWPGAFDANQVAVTGGTQYVRLGGKGPAVLLLHGFGDTGDMWVPLAEALVKDHAVIVPDLRGMGLSSHPEGGYQKVAQARDLATILDQLGFQEIALVILSPRSKVQGSVIRAHSHGVITPVRFVYRLLPHRHTTMRARPQ
jgi:alpha-beta hydrolase superfamily lysophospholipase